MGAVYRAHDTRLNREVAIKVLPDALANDPDYLARFTREAQVLASLNHPTIAIIHGVEESLSIRDQQRIAKAILSPPAPTSAFRNAAKRYRELFDNE